MDSYLEIARTVLQSSRQPLSARQILKTASQMQLVPRDLYGRTQHKTLQARLSTDILKRRSKSAFYRTGPGRFFLRAMQFDRSIPPRYRHEYQAPLRAAQLGRFDVVAFPTSALTDLARSVSGSFPIARLSTLPWKFDRLFNLRTNSKFAPFRFILILVADGRTLLNNQKPISTEGDLYQRSSIGIEGYVRIGDLSLFSLDSFGLIDAAGRTLLEQLDLPRNIRPQLNEIDRWSAARAVIDVDDQTHADLVVYVSFRCGDIKEVCAAVEDRAAVEWIQTPIKINDLDRFDKWSTRLVQDAKLQLEVFG